MNVIQAGHARTPLRRRLERVVGWLVLMAGCDADCGPDTGNPPESAVAPLTTGSAGSQSIPPAKPPTTASATPEADPQSPKDTRPSIDENMGRGFQGALTLRLVTADGERGIRYLGRGNTARVQLDATADEPAFDALIWEENITVFDHERRGYKTLSLDGLPARDEPDPEVRVEKTGERINVQGVFCERYEIEQGPLRVRACVTAVPGEVDVDDLEAVGSFNVPAWVEYLLNEELFPLTAEVRDQRGKELYRLELVAYSAGPIADDQLTIPQGYGPL